MKKEQLVGIINRLMMYANEYDEDGNCWGCDEPCDDVGVVAHAEGCGWIQLQEDIEEAQGDA